MPDYMQTVYPEIPLLERAVVVLASASPRRRELLARLLPLSQFVVLAADIDESVRPDELPAAYVQRVAQEKAVRGVVLAKDFAQPDRPLLILSADTSVVLGDKIFGKPGTPAKATQMLGELSGRTHQVMTGVAINVVRPDGRITTEKLLCTTDVEMRSISPVEINWYVATGEPLDKAGAYAVQGFGGVLIAAVRGDYYNVVGLPLGPLVKLLRKIAL